MFLPFPQKCTCDFISLLTFKKSYLLNWHCAFTSQGIKKHHCLRNSSRVHSSRKKKLKHSFMNCFKSSIFFLGNPTGIPPWIQQKILFGYIRFFSVATSEIFPGTCLSFSKKKNLKKNLPKNCSWAFLRISLRNSSRNLLKEIEISKCNY